MSLDTQTPTSTPNLDGMLSADDIKKLTELLGNNSVLLDKGNGIGNKKGKKNKKMTPQAKHNLLNQLSSSQTTHHKPVEEMNADEKKAYREELKKRLHNKQDMFRQMRSNQNLLQKSYDAKIKKSTELMKKEEVAKAIQSAVPLEQIGANIQTNDSTEHVEKKDLEDLEDLEDLDEFVN